MMAKILIIDDDKLIRWSLSQVFSQEDYSVDSVATAEAAVEHVMKNSYHLIITDLEIDANNSFQMLSKIPAYQPWAKIVIISALPRKEIEPLIEGVSIYEIVEKPYS